MIIAIFYLVLIASAEAVTVFNSLLWGVLFHLAILIFLMLHSGLGRQLDQRRFLLSLTLVPLVRIVSLAMPLENIRPIFWYPIIYLPLLAACAVVMFILRETSRRVGLVVNKLPWQLLIMLSGLAFGIAEYYILKPEALIPELVLGEAWLPALILIVFPGFVEELMFRGILQRTTIEFFGSRGIIYVSLLFAILHMGYHNWIDFGFVFAVGVFFGWMVKKTGSLLGVTLAHGITNILLYLVMPFYPNLISQLF